LKNCPHLNPLPNGEEAATSRVSVIAPESGAFSLGEKARIRVSQ
jgi:hypothetical protein